MSSMGSVLTNMLSMDGIVQEVLSLVNCVTYHFLYMKPISHCTLGDIPADEVIQTYQTMQLMKD